MRTSTHKVGTYQLGSGHNVVRMPTGVEILQISGLTIVTWEPMSPASTNEHHYWVFDSYERAPDELVSHLIFVHAVTDGSLVQTLWRDRRHPRARRPLRKS